MQTQLRALQTFANENFKDEYQADFIRMELAKTENDYTPLMLAAELKNVKILQKLLDAGANPRQEINSKSALSLAAKLNNDACVAALLHWEITRGNPSIGRDLYITKAQLVAEGKARDIINTYLNSRQSFMTTVSKSLSLPNIWNPLKLFGKSQSQSFKDINENDPETPNKNFASEKNLSKSKKDL